MKNYNKKHLGEKVAWAVIGVPSVITCAWVDWRVTLAMFILAWIENGLRTRWRK